jgi:GPI ethanolamine phosphate transferase 1
MQSSGISSDTIYPLSSPPAKRVILFISDGTKADSVFGLDKNNLPYAPFLRSIVEERGSFGVSLTSPPTESKICVSNIVTGHFFDLTDLLNMFFYDEMIDDHILNESKYSWSFGQPEIVNLFKATKGDIHRITITPDDISIQQNESCLQNFRVFDQLEEFFKKAKDDKVLDQKLRSDKVIIMVHLICVDLIGHIFKPFSEAYTNKIRSTDSLIEKAVKLISNFYQDDQTSFIFTSDHGMKATGVHADGSLENIRTPFIAWGAGLAIPSKGPHTPLTHDEYSLPWKLSEYERKDVRQVDIAPLISSLIGIPIPVNSEGVTPLDYFEADSKRKAEAGYLNAKQICSMLARREELWEESSIRSFFSTSLMQDIDEKLEIIFEFILMEDYWAA